MFCTKIQCNAYATQKISKFQVKKFQQNKLHQNKQQQNKTIKNKFQVTKFNTKNKNQHQNQHQNLQQNTKQNQQRNTKIQYKKRKKKIFQNKTKKNNQNSNNNNLQKTPIKGKYYIQVTFDDFPCSDNIFYKILNCVNSHPMCCILFVNSSRMRINTLENLLIWLMHNHKIGNHTHSHVSLRKVSIEKFKKEIKMCDTYLQNAINNKKLIEKITNQNITKIIKNTNITSRLKSKDLLDNIIKRNLSNNNKFLGLNNENDNAIAQNMQNYFINNIEKNTKIQQIVQTAFQHLHEKQKYFRLPYLDRGGKKFHAINQYLNENNYQIVNVTIDSRDWWYNSKYIHAKNVKVKQQIVQNFLNNLNKILSIHGNQYENILFHTTQITADHIKEIMNLILKNNYTLM